MSEPTLTNIGSIKVCVVGGGSIGSLHAELHAKRNGVQQVGVVEINDELRAQYEAQGMSVYAKLDDSLKDGYDLYDICLPTFLHLKSIENILDNTDARIICEKPLVLNYDEFLQLESRGLEAESRLMCAFVERFNSPFILAKEWCDQQQGPFSMEFVRRTKKPVRQDWVKDSAKGGNVILDLGIHDIDASLWFSDASYASIVSHNSTEDSEAFIIKLEDNTIISYTVGWDIPQESDVGIINSFLVKNDSATFEYDSARETVITTGGEMVVNPRFPAAYAAELEAAMNLKDYIDSRYPTFGEMRHVYKVLKDLEEKKY